MLLGTMSAMATDRYVSKTGSSDAGPGSIGAPWLTIQYAITNSDEGDVIHIGAGTYDQALTVDKGLTFMGTNTAGEVIITSSSGTTFTVSAGSVIIQDELTFSNTGDFNTISVTGSLKIRHCTINETSGSSYDRYAVYDAGGPTDAGTNSTDQAGHNKFIVNTPGKAMYRSGSTMNAIGNYWGGTTGPLHTNNPCGNGGEITGTVAYSPWKDYTADGTDYTAQGTAPNITITAASVCSGATYVDIPVTVENFTNVGNLSLRFIYDNSKLINPTVVDMATGMGASGWNNVVYGVPVANRFAVSGYGTQFTLADNAILFKIRFTINSGTTSAVTFDNSLPSYNEFSGSETSDPAIGIYCDLPLGTHYIDASGGMTVVADPTLSTPDNITLCKGGVSQELTTAPTGGTGTYSYQWQYSANGTDGWADVVSSTPAYFTYTNGNTATLTIAAGLLATTGNSYYKCVLTSLTPVGGSCNAETGVVTVTANDPFFVDNYSTPQYSLTFNEALSRASAVSANEITQLQDYTQLTDANISFDVTINFAGWDFLGAKVNTIGSSKTFSIRNAGAGMIFNGKIKFGNSTSTVRYLSDNITFGTDFTTVDSPSLGRFILGDGTIAFSIDWPNGHPKFVNVASVTVKGSASANITFTTTGSTIQDFYIDNGGLVVLSNTSNAYTNIFVSTEFSSASSATIQIGNGSGIRTVTGYLSDFYGNLNIYDGATLVLGGSGSTPAKVSIGGGSNIAVTTLKPTGGQNLSGLYNSPNTLELSDYDVLDLTSRTADFTAADNVYITNYSSANAGKVKFLLSLGTTYRLLCDAFNTNGTDGVIDVSKSFVLDMNNITTTDPATQAFQLARTTTLPVVTGTPILSNATGWQNPVVSVIGAGPYFIVLQANYCVNPTDGGTIGSAQTICTSTSPTELSNVASPTGHVGTLTYQWQSSIDNISFANINDATLSTYAPGNLTEDTWFKRLTKVECAAGWSSAESNVVKVTVNNLTPGSIAGAQTICYGGDPVAFTSGGDGTAEGDITYRWEYNTNIATPNWSTIADATSTTYNSVTLFVTTQFHRVIISTLSGVPCEAASDAVTVTVNDEVAAGTIGTNQVICYNTAPALLTSESAGTGSGTITYEWQTNASGSYVTIENATEATYQPEALTTTTSYRRLTVSLSGGTTCKSDYTTAVVITVNDNVTVGTIGTSQVICYNTAPAGLTSETPGTGSGTITYEWQSKTSGAYADISGATEATYAPLALTTTTTYQRRTVSLSGGKTCYSGYTTPIVITVNQLQSITGSITYYNLANTPLSSTANNLTMMLNRSSDNVTVAVVNPSSGIYTFSNLCPDSYYIEIISSQATEGSVNTTDAAQAHYWSAVGHYSIERVRLFAGDVTGASDTPDGMVSATDAQRMQMNFVSGTAFDRGWTFWKTADPTTENSAIPPALTVVLPVNETKTQNIYGLAPGDFNRSFIPYLGAGKISNNLFLTTLNTIPVANNATLEMPIVMQNAGGVGAVSMILNFPSELATVSDVVMNTANGDLSWAVNGNELRIGWNSLSPMFLAAGDVMATIKLNPTAAFVNGSTIEFTLVGSSLNELADEMYNVIPEASLSMNAVKSSTEPMLLSELSLASYPNPFNTSTTIAYSLPEAGKVTLELFNYLGSRVKTIASEVQAEGSHLYKVDAATLTPGLYMAKLTYKNQNNELVKVIKLVYNH